MSTNFNYKGSTFTISDHKGLNKLFDEKFVQPFQIIFCTREDIELIYWLINYTCCGKRVYEL